MIFPVHGYDLICVSVCVFDRVLLSHCAVVVKLQDLFFFEINIIDWKLRTNYKKQQQQQQQQQQKTYVMMIMVYSI